MCRKVKRPYFLHANACRRVNGDWQPSQNLAKWSNFCYTGHSLHPETPLPKDQTFLQQSVTLSASQTSFLHWFFLLRELSLLVAHSITPPTTLHVFLPLCADVFSAIETFAFCGLHGKTVLINNSILKNHKCFPWRVLRLIMETGWVRHTTTTLSCWQTKETSLHW